MGNSITLIQLAMGALVLCVLIAVGVLGFHVFRNSKLGESSGLFQPRLRRLSFIERASLDGGRKLLLIRRDDVEHLVMIGGPIDIVVETGIQPPRFNGEAGRESGYGDHDPNRIPVMDREWRVGDGSRPRDKFAPVPNLSFTSKLHGEEEEALELTQHYEAKA